MNRLRSIIPSLILINVFVAILSVVFVMVMRNQQTQITAQAQRLNTPRGNNTEIKAKLREYEQQIQEKHQKIQSYEQQLKGVQAELDEYKNQNNLLMQVAHSQEESVTPVGATSPKQTTTSEVKSAPVKNVAKTMVIQPKRQVKPSPTRKVAYNAPSNNTVNIVNSVTPQSPTPQTQLLERKEEALNKTSLPNIAKIETREEIQNQANENYETQLIDYTNLLAQKMDQEKLYPNPLDKEIVKDSHYYANNLVRGLRVAADKGQINPGTKTHKEINTIVANLRREKTLEEAIRKANADPKVVEQVMKWGEESRPGNKLYLARQE